MSDDKEPLLASESDLKPEPQRRNGKRLSRQSSLQESTDYPLPPTEGKTRICPGYFGVKSYVHQFYETHFFKDPSIYEEDDCHHLLGNKSSRRRCHPLWWKVFTWIGINLLVLGCVGILVGFLVPRKALVIKSDGNSDDVKVDEGIVQYNHILDMCKVVGLVVFCVGGTSLTLALLFPSFLGAYLDDDRNDDVIHVSYGDDEKKPPLSPVEMTVPAAKKMKNVQPKRDGAESLMTQHGTVRFED